MYMRILLVEDDINLADVNRRLLVREGYVVDVAPSVAIAKAAVVDIKYDIILLDRMLPDGDGLELIKFSEKKNIPNRFLVLSALNDVDERIQGLDIGADDYIPKPFEPEELLARIRAALRHGLEEIKKEIKCGQLIFDCVGRSFQINGDAFVLPRRELIVLETLIQRVGRVTTRETIESEMYGYDDEILSNSLESHISKLRKNLKEHNIDASIHTVRGVGYILKETTNA
ncbi:DNA-binding response regulator [Parashewanella curva]|uniref:DNA-binding response regulator n=1 Tax=Parashewanella curva TaxID=2338552 RepID=A0A3L8PX05_9GAMM|nr:response regulator transcription factor [Parashewanella curva]RLV59875.1 DNA-binding response regulator [Parashewanella curva]